MASSPCRDSAPGFVGRFIAGHLDAVLFHYAFGFLGAGALLGMKVFAAMASGVRLHHCYVDLKDLAREQECCAGEDPGRIVRARMPLERLTTQHQLAELAPEWRQLEANAVPLPFATGDWVAAWWANLRAERFALRDRLFTLALRDGGGKLLGVAPLMITERPSVGPVKARQLQFIGADANLTEIRGLLAREGCEELVYREVRDYVLAAGDEWDLMTWSGVDAAGAGSRLLDECGAAWEDNLSDWILPLPRDWEAFHAGLSRNIRESLRKCRNAPRRDGIEFRFEVATDPAAVGSALERFFALHAERAAQAGTVRHRDNFGRTATRAFLREVCQRFAKRGVTHVFTLMHGDEAVATRIGFLIHSSMYLYYSGFQHRYARYSVMTACLAEAIRWSIGAGARSVNLSTGTDVSKLRWGPREHVFRTARLSSRSVRGRLVGASLNWARHQLAQSPSLQQMARIWRRGADP